MKIMFDIMLFITAIVLGLLYGYAINKLTKNIWLLRFFIIMMWLAVGIIILFLNIAVGSIWERVLSALAISGNIGTLTFQNKN